jgi:hypothetical protein
MLQERTPIVNMDFFPNLGCENPHATMRLSATNNYLGASPLVLSVCDPAQIFFTSKFSSLLFYNATHKTANRWELLIANNLDQSF